MTGISALAHVGSVRSGDQRLQIVLGRGESVLRAVGVQFEVRQLRLRRHHVDGRQQSLLLLPAIAFVLLAADPDGVQLHGQIAVGVRQLPVRLLGLLDDLHHPQAKLFIGERQVLLRDFQPVAVLVVAQIAPQRLRVREIQRGWILRIELVKRVVGGVRDEEKSSW